MIIDDMYEADYSEGEKDDLAEIDDALEGENFTEEAQNAQYGGDD